MSNQKHLRELDHRWFDADLRAAPELIELLQAEVVPVLELTGKKLAEKRETAVTCLANLIVNGQIGKTVADYRSTAKAGVRLRRAVWDSITAAGYANVSIGSQDSGKVTRYKATKRLTRLVDSWGLGNILDVDLSRNTEGGEPSIYALVVLKDSDTDEALPFDDMADLTRSMLEDYEDTIEFINRQNLTHTWQAFNDEGKVFQPNVCLRQLHIDKPCRYARLYSWSSLSGQNLPKKWRAGMLIDGEPVVELDYSSYQIRMLYHIHKLDPSGDLYRPAMVLPRFYESVDCIASAAAACRDWIKEVTNAMLNAGSQAEARRAAAKALKDHEQYDLIADALYQVEEIRPGEVVDRIASIHSPVADCFFDRRGQWLQTLDGCVMLDILMCFADEERPALGIHDSVVCRRRDIEFCRAMMTIEYNRRFGFEPLISQAL